MILDMIFSSCNSPRNQAMEREAENEYIVEICKYSLLEHHYNAVK